MSTECLSDKMLEKLDDSIPESADTRQLRNLREYNEAGLGKYEERLKPHLAEDGKTELPALLDEVKDKNGNVVAAIPCLQAIEMLNHVDFREVGRSINLNNMYRKNFGLDEDSGNLVIGLNNVYFAGKVLAHTGDVPPTAQQIYDAIKDAELKGEFPGPRPPQVWHLRPYHGP